MSICHKSSLITEDSEYALYTVVLFKRIAEDFKNLAREKKYFYIAKLQNKRLRFTVRDFSLEQLSEKSKEIRKQKVTERDTQRVIDVSFLPQI